MVIEKLGDPNSQSQIGGQKAYTWSSTGIPEAFGFRCIVRVFVDKRDRITRYALSGNSGGCAYFAHELDNSYDLVEAQEPHGLRLQALARASG